MTLTHWSLTFFSKTLTFIINTCKTLSLKGFSSLKFLMRQKKQCQFWNLWWGPFWLSQFSSFNIFTSVSKNISKILSHKWNEFHIQLQSIEFLFITFSLLLEHVCLRYLIGLRAIHSIMSRWKAWCHNNFAIFTFSMKITCENINSIQRFHTWKCMLF
jgi:hypothetical protein